MSKRSKEYVQDKFNATAMNSLQPSLNVKLRVNVARSGVSASKMIPVFVSGAQSHTFYNTLVS